MRFREVERARAYVYYHTKHNLPMVEEKAFTTQDYKYIKSVNKNYDN